MTKTARQLAQEVADQAKQIADLKADVTYPLTPAQARKRRDRLRAEKLEEDKTTLIKAINFVLTGDPNWRDQRSWAVKYTIVGRKPAEAVESLYRSKGWAVEFIGEHIVLSERS